MKKLIIDPYFLGIWLGDGDSDTMRITTPDTEIINYLLDYGKNIGLNPQIYPQKNNKSVRVSMSNNDVRGSRPVKATNIITKEIFNFNSLTEAAKILNIKNSGNINHAITGRYNHCGGYTFEYVGNLTCTNYLRLAFQENNLLNNKHIPKYIMKGSLEDKAKILAGFIDSDGTKESRQVLSISQKFDRLDMMKDFQSICNDLNIPNELLHKTMKLKYKNYEVYNYWKLRMRGDNLKSLPILLTRKQIN